MHPGSMALDDGTVALGLLKRALDALEAVQPVFAAELRRFLAS